MIEQAIYGIRSPGGYAFLARSPGFDEDWIPEAERLCTSFGERPPGVSCPQSLFAYPFADRYVAVVQVGDRGRDDAGRPGALAFRLMIVPRLLYEDIGGDLFYLDEKFPPEWNPRGTLPTLTLSEPPPRRDVASLHKVLDVPNCATLLGGTQVLVDGGRLAFERREPADTLIKSIWSLLPTSTRSELWPSTFSFSNKLQFHLAVVPRVEGEEYADYVLEEQAGDYPEGRYELAVQTAIESDDQATLDVLFSRRSRSQTLKLGVILLVAFLAAPLVMSVFRPAPVRKARPTSPSPSKSAVEPKPKKPVPKPNVVAFVPESPELDESEAYLPLDPRERMAFARRLARMAQRLDIPPPTGTTEAELVVGLESLDARLGTPDPRRDPSRRGWLLQAMRSFGGSVNPGSQAPLLTASTFYVGETGRLRDQGPIQRQVRLLLWKHHVEKYDRAGPNADELLEMLETKINQAYPRTEKP